MKKSLIIFLVILMLCSSFKANSEELLGKWKCYHKELEDGTVKSTDLDGKEFEYSCNELIFDIKPDGTAWESLSEQIFKYELKDSILSIGDRSFVVELLNDEQLILRDYNKDGISIFNFRRKFNRQK